MPDSRHLEWNRRIAMLGLRLLIGTVSLLLGYHKIFVLGLDDQFKWFVRLEQWFPVWLLVTVNYYAAYVELIAGCLVFIGLLRDVALYLILSVLVIVTIGHSLEEAVWDMHQLVFRTLMLVPLLVLPASWDVFRLDMCFRATRELAGLRTASSAA